MFRPNQTIPNNLMALGQTNIPQYNPIAANPGPVRATGSRMPQRRTQRERNHPATINHETVQQVPQKTNGTADSRTHAKSDISSQANVGIESQLGLLKRQPSTTSPAEPVHATPVEKKVSDPQPTKLNRPVINRFSVQPPSPSTMSAQQEQKMKLAQLLNKFQAQNNGTLNSTSTPHPQTAISHDVSDASSFSTQTLQTFLESHPNPHDIAQRIYQLVNSRLDSERTYFTKEIESLKNLISSTPQPAPPSFNLSTHPEWVQQKQQVTNIIAQLNQLRTSTQVQFNNMTKLLREQKTRTDGHLQECSQKHTQLDEMFQAYKKEIQETIRQLSELVRTPQKDASTNTETEPTPESEAETQTETELKAEPETESKTKAKASKTKTKPTKAKASAKDTSKDDEFQDKIIVISEDDKPKRRGRRPRKTTTT